MKTNPSPLMTISRFTLPLVLLLVILTGCGDRGKEVKPTKLTINGADVRASRLLATQPVQFEIFGTPEKTMLGGTPKPPPAANVPVTVVIDKQPEGAQATIELVGDETQTGTSIQSRTNSGGTVAVQLNLGDKPGVYVIKLSLPDFPELGSKKVVFLGGMIVNAGDKEVTAGGSIDGWVGHTLDPSYSVQLETAPGIFAKEGYVQVVSKKAPKKTKASGDKDTANEKGEFIQKVKIKLGGTQGKGTIALRAFESPLGPEAAQYPVEVNYFAIDRIGLIIKLLGGLAIFIFGMKMMSEGLSLSAGDRLRSLLNVLTKNRFAAAFAGLVTTGLIQSSSACTVMVVGFVNAGLMQLEQAIGVIMGSNIGTTVTAQMISFKLGHLALPAIAIGMVMMLTAKKSQTKFLAQILLGFGFLFFGMSQLAAPFKELKDSAMIVQMFEGISCDPMKGHLSIITIVKAVSIGTLMTVVVQSSSASIGLLLALASVGLIDPYTGFAILLGDNIGTTITAILASIGTSKNAKRAACAHCLFNLIGSGVMIGLFFVPWPGIEGHRPVFMHLVSLVTDGNNFVGDNIVRFLANCHTLFNVSCTLIFLGFVPVFAKACRAIISGTDEHMTARKSFLEPHLLASPSIAIQQAWAELGYMLHLGRKMHKESFTAMLDSDTVDLESANDSIRSQEDQLDGLQHAITDYLSELSREPLNETQGEAIPHLLHSVNDAERIGDHGISFLRQARRMNKRSLSLTPEAKDELQAMFKVYGELYEQCLNIVTEYAKGEESHDPDVIREHLNSAKNTTDKLKRMSKDLYRAHIERQEEGNCDVRSGVIFTEAIRTLNRSGGHVMNIIEATSPLEGDH